jgi:hypothetical protein
VLVVGFFAGTAWESSDPVTQAGALLVAAGALSIMGTLWRRGGVAPMPPEAVAQQCLAWRRQELERQRALLAGVWRWYLGPLVPGLGLLLLARALQADGPGELAAVGAVALLCALLFGGVGRMNRAAARSLEAELAALREEP